MLITFYCLKSAVFLYILHIKENNATKTLKDFETKLMCLHLKKKKFCSIQRTVFT